MKINQMILGFILLFMLSLTAFAQKKIVNVYTWAGEIPDAVLNQFEKETGIKVNISYYSNNEIMYAKLRTAKTAGYDVILPSGYFVDRMRRQNMLEVLDKGKLPNFKNIDPIFLNPSYDPNSQYSVPFIWGIAGIFVNQEYWAPNTVKRWADLWQARFRNQLLLVDDTREVFNIGLLTLGYSPNDQNPDHIRQAFLKLKTLIPNVKVFSSDTVVSIIIDEDATVGMAWNGDAYKASQENPNIKFNFPEDGFVIIVDNFAIPKNAPHKDAAYAFINFLLRPDISKVIAVYSHFPITNAAARALLPEEMRNNPIIYPPKEVLQRGQFQTDLTEETLELYEKYWDELKMSA